MQMGCSNNKSERGKQNGAPVVDVLTSTSNPGSTGSSICRP
jgi:hypothetical protein